MFSVLFVRLKAFSITVGYIDLLGYRSGVGFHERFCSAVDAKLSCVSVSWGCCHSHPSTERSLTSQVCIFPFQQEGRTPLHLSL